MQRLGDGEQHSKHARDGAGVIQRNAQQHSSQDVPNDKEQDHKAKRRHREIEQVAKHSYGVRLRHFGSEGRSAAMPMAITPGTRAIPMITLSQDRVAIAPGWLAGP
jgi:hypothetical protein